MSDDATQDPPAFDPAAFETKVLEAMNKGLTAREKKFDTALQAALKTQQDAFSVKLEEMLAKGTTTTAAGDEPAGGKVKTDDVTIKTFEKRLGDMAKQLEAAQREKEEERAKTAAVEMRRKAGEELAKAGVTNPIQAKHLLNSLVAEGRVKTDEDGRLLWSEDGNDVEFAVGVRSFVKTEEGKFFMPPSGARGAGSNAGSGNGGGNKNTTAQAQDVVWEKVGEALRNGG